jgi:hypothetical protein
MQRQKLEIGHPLKCEVIWYDAVPEPPHEISYEGEVIGWRDTQVVVRVKDYAVVRFWIQKGREGREVGNLDHARRGLRIDLSSLNESVKPAPGVTVDLSSVEAT